MWAYIDGSVQDCSNSIANALELVGLDLFNDDTRPSGHISRPLRSGIDIYSWLMIT